jgi:hypothetical protein
MKIHAQSERTCSRRAEDPAAISTDDVVSLIDLIFGQDSDARDSEGEDIFDDKRSATRQPVLLPAVIFSDSLGPYRCVIRDLSAGGARLAVSKAAKLAPEMRVRVSGKRSRIVRCVWRKAEFVGIQFR